MNILEKIQHADSKFAAMFSRMREFATTTSKKYTEAVTALALQDFKHIQHEFYTTDEDEVKNQIFLVSFPKVNQIQKFVLIPDIVESMSMTQRSMIVTKLPRMNQLRNELFALAMETKESFMKKWPVPVNLRTLDDIVTFVKRLMERAELINEFIAKCNTIISAYDDLYPKPTS